MCVPARDNPEQSERGPYPHDPAQAIAQAYLNGLSALRDLFRERTIKSTEDVYASTQRQWTEALNRWRHSRRSGKPDFSHITNVERHMRRNFNKMIWETTARYGNKEYKRIQNERKGKVGPLNRLLNMAGAQLRNWVVTRFPFPEPKTAGRRGKRWIAGYEGGGDYPWVEVAHTVLAELDFGDMLRAHIFELCRKCFINDVPMNDARRYVGLLIWRLSPFLEYLYTSKESGRRGFKRSRRGGRKDSEQPDADRILREIVQEIEALYGTHCGRALSLTESIGGPRIKWDLSFFLDQVTQLRYPEEEVSEDEIDSRQAWAEFLKDLCERGILRDEDGEWLQKEVMRRARWHGIRWHRLMTNGLVQPYDLESVVLSGDRWVEEGDEWLLAAEVPVETSLGRGRADLVMFKRHVIQNPRVPGKLTVWKPVAVFDIKSKTAFNWEIRAEKKDSKKHGQKVIPKFILRKRGLTNAEWNASVVSTPTEYGMKQLAAYAEGLAAEYVRITEDRSVVRPLTGTVVIDTSQDSSLVRPKLWKVTRALCEDALTLLKDHLSKPVEVTLDDGTRDWLKLAIIVHGTNADQLKQIGKKGQPLREAEQRCPLEENGEARGRFILYLSVNSASRSGPSAAWIAKYWHGLELIHGLQQESDHSEVLWLDLVGDFRTKSLAETRLGLIQFSDHMRELLRAIRVSDASSAVQDFLFRGIGDMSVAELLGEERSALDGRVAVVSGWDVLDDCTPKRLRPALYEMRDIIAAELNEAGCTVVWFDGPRNSELTSESYQRRAMEPFFEGSELSRLVTEVVWNLPVRPYASGQLTSAFDDLRIIIRQDNDDVSFDMVEVPPLHNWSPRFWNEPRRASVSSAQEGERGRTAIRSADVMHNSEMQDEFFRDSIELVPQLRQYLSESMVQKADDTGGRKIHVVPLSEYESKSRPAGAPFLRYRTRMQTVGHGRAFVASVALLPRDSITHQRGYRKDSIRECTGASIYRPPIEATLRFSHDIERAIRLELRRLRQAVRILRQVGHEKDGLSWSQFLDELDELISIADGEQGHIETLDDIVSFLQTSPVSEPVWATLQWVRDSRLIEGLRAQDRELLLDLFNVRPYLSVSFGNYLFLLLLGLTREFPTLADRHLAELWRTLKSWQLMQMGFVLPDSESGEVTPRLDLRAVWSGLAKRAKAMTSLNVPELSTVSYGQILVLSEEDETPEYCLAIEDPYDRGKMLMGVWIGCEPFVPKQTVSWTAIRQDEIALCLSKHASATTTYDVIVHRSAGADYFWFRDDEDWTPLGSLTTIRRRGETLAGIRGLQITTMPEQDFPLLPEWLRFPRGLGKRVQGVLEEISESLSLCVSTKCTLDVDEDYYTIEFNRADGNELIESWSIQHTSELLALLRRPIVDGLPLQSLKDTETYLTWNPYDDIDYDALEILRPYVERRTPYIRFRTTLPSTAEDLTGRKVAYQTLVVTHDEELCPIASGEAEYHGACWRVELLDGDKDSRLSGLTKTGLGDSEISAMLSAGGVFLGNTWHEFTLEFIPDPTTREGMVFRESRQIASKLGLRAIRAGSYLEMDEEKLVCNVLKFKSEIQLSARSNKTGEQVYNWVLATTPTQNGLDETLNHAESLIQEIVESHFGSDEEAKEKIEDYDGLISKIERLLRSATR